MLFISFYVDLLVCLRIAISNLGLRMRDKKTENGTKWQNNSVHRRWTNEFFSSFFFFFFVFLKLWCEPWDLVTVLKPGWFDLSLHGLLNFCVERVLKVKELSSWRFPVNRVGPYDPVWISKPWLRTLDLSQKAEKGIHGWNQMVT